MDVIETLEMNGKTVQVYVDNNPLNPREFDGGNIARLIIETRYISVDELGFEIGKRESLEADINALKKQENMAFVGIIFGHSHGEVSFSMNPFSDSWDSGIAGLAIVRREDITRHFGWKRITSERMNSIVKMVDNELQTYSHYRNGNCYGFAILENDNIIEMVDGFYGYNHKISGLYETANAMTMIM